MTRNKVPASSPTAPCKVTEGVFRVAASTEYYRYIDILSNTPNNVDTSIMVNTYHTANTIEIT